jgi:ATP-binding cassette subfamily B protein
MRDQFRDATMLLATHDVGATRLFERVLVMHDGEIVEDGAPATLAARAGSRYARLIETDRLLRDRLWRSGDWRRLYMADGIISETPVTPLRHRTHLGAEDGGSRWTA